MSAYEIDIKTNLPPNDLRTNIENVKERVKDTKNSITKTIYDVKENASNVVYDSIDDIKTKTDGIRSTVSSYAYHKPVRSILIALVAGIVVGKLL